MSQTTTTDVWARAKGLLESRRESGEKMSNIRLLDTNGEGEVLPECLVKVLLQAARELELGRTPVVTHGDLPVDFIQASLHSMTSPEVMELAVQVGQFPCVRLPDGRPLIPLRAVADMFTEAIPDELLSTIREVTEAETNQEDQDNHGGGPF